MIEVYSDSKMAYMYDTEQKKYSTYSSYGLREHVHNMITGNEHYGWHNQSFDLEYEDVPLVATVKNLEKLNTFFEDHPEVLL